MSRKDRAITNLIWYIEHAWEAAGLHWDSDNDAEVADIVDAILDAVKEEK